MALSFPSLSIRTLPTRGSQKVFHRHFLPPPFPPPNPKKKRETRQRIRLFDPLTCSFFPSKTPRPEVGLGILAPVFVTSLSHLSSSHGALSIKSFFSVLPPSATFSLTPSSRYFRVGGGPPLLPHLCLFLASLEGCRLFVPQTLSSLRVSSS